MTPCSITTSLESMLMLSTQGHLHSTRLSCAVVIFCVIFFLQVLDAECRKFFVDMFLFFFYFSKVQILCFKKTLRYFVQYIVKECLRVLCSS